MGEPSGWQLASGSVAEAYERYISLPLAMRGHRRLSNSERPMTESACSSRLWQWGCRSACCPARRTHGRRGRARSERRYAAIARAISHREGVAIEWREGNPTALPFPDGSFDPSAVSKGLIFFRTALPTLQVRVCRVLVPGGRLALGVWRDLEHQPFYAALTAALERYVSSESAASLRAAFTLANAEEIRA